MYDLISIGNISLDLFFQGESLTYEKNRFQLAVGGKYFVNTLYQSVGGGGANVAIGASMNGLKTAVLGKIGQNSFKSMFLDELREKNVSTSLCQIEEHYLNISSILLTAEGERAIIHYAPAHVHILKSKKDLENIIKTKFLYLGNLPDVPMSEREQLLSFVKSHNVTTFVNLGVKDCRRPRHQLTHFLNKVDVLILNGHEFADLVKAPYRDIHFHENVVNWYFPALRDKIVVITEGKKGSYTYLNDQIYHQKAFELNKVVDTTGAGDAFTAGFISDYFKSQNILSSMERGAKYATKILSKMGAN